MTGRLARRNSIEGDSERIDTRSASAQVRE